MERINNEEVVYTPSKMYTDDLRNMYRKIMPNYKKAHESVQRLMDDVKLELKHRKMLTKDGKLKKMSKKMIDGRFSPQYKENFNTILNVFNKVKKSSNRSKRRKSRSRSRSTKKRKIKRRKSRSKRR